MKAVNKCLMLSNAQHITHTYTILMAIPQENQS